MQIKKLMLNSPDFPETLRHIPAPPRQLYHAGAPLIKLLERPAVAVVGSRMMSAYGQTVTRQLAGQLAERGAVIVSGLALGVDAAAHRAALEAGGLTIAVLPGPLERIVPATNRGLATRIVERGGALVSEYAAGMPALKQNFIARNRLMAGLARAVLITEAGAKSGTLHTATFALEQGKEVLAVPGNINSRGSAGTNHLLKTGATPATSVRDVLHALGLPDDKAAAKRAAIRGRNAPEQAVLDLLLSGVSDGGILLERSQLPASQFNQVLTMLEISGKIRALGANQWSPD